jgi:hypothetical protein
LLAYAIVKIELEIGCCCYLTFGHTHDYTWPYI